MTIQAESYITLLKIIREIQHETLQLKLVFIWFN